MTMVDASYILNELDTYCRNDVESTRKMFITTANPYREEKITKDVLDSFVYSYKIDKEFDRGLTKIIEEVKEKENMFVNSFAQANDIKVTFNGRECNVLNGEIKHPGDPREMPTIKLECSMTRSSIPYHEYAKQKKTTEEPKFPTIRAMDIKNVIFNPPATIVFWTDGTKTVVKASNEEFDAEKGLAMAYTKKILGNKGHYFETVKKWVKPYEEAHPKLSINAGLKPVEFEFSVTGCSINPDELGELIGTTKDGAKFYINAKPKEDEV